MSDPGGTVVSQPNTISCFLGSYSLDVMNLSTPYSCSNLSNSSASALNQGLDFWAF